MKTLMQLKAIEKKYFNKYALQGVDLNFNSGKITGLLGPNGSGKTTLMKIIAGLLQPTSGEIIYPNNALRGVESKKTISFLPDTLVFPEYMLVQDAFNFYKDMYPDYSKDRSDEMISLLDIGDLMENKITNLSKGMQERLALGLTFSRETCVYILDEPLGGVDPVGKSKVIDAILSMQLENSSIVISTHLVKDMEQIFDSVYFISGGKIVFEGNCDQMREEKRKTVEQFYLEVFAHEGAI